MRTTQSAETKGFGRYTIGDKTFILTASGPVPLESVITPSSTTASSTPSFPDIEERDRVAFNYENLGTIKKRAAVKLGHAKPIIHGIVEEYCKIECPGGEPEFKNNIGSRVSILSLNAPIIHGNVGEYSTIESKKGAAFINGSIAARTSIICDDAPVITGNIGEYCTIKCNRGKLVFQGNVADRTNIECVGEPEFKGTVGSYVTVNGVNVSMLKARSSADILNRLGSTEETKALKPTRVTGDFFSSSSTLGDFELHGESLTQFVVAENPHLVLGKVSIKGSTPEKGIIQVGIDSRTPLSAQDDFNQLLNHLLNPTSTSAFRPSGS